MLRARWQSASACNNSAWIILRPLRQPIPCANNSASHVRPYMQRTTWKPHTNKRATLLLLVLALHIDRRRNTPTPYTLSSVPYRPRIPTPRKDNQRATYTPQLFAPSTGRTLHFFSCVVSCLLSCTHSTDAAILARFTLEGLQPTRIHSTSTCNQRRQRFNCEPPPLLLTTPPTIQSRKASRNHCRQFRHPGLFRPAFPQWIAPTVNERPPAEHEAARLAAALATIRPPEPNQPPPFAPTGQRFPAFRRIFADDPPQRAPALLRACLHIYARMHEFLHIRNENYIPYSTNARKALI